MKHKTAEEIKYKGVWKPQYMAEFIFNRKGMSIQDVELHLTSWAIDILEANQPSQESESMRGDELGILKSTLKHQLSDNPTSFTPSQVEGLPSEEDLEKQFPSLNGNGYHFKRNGSRKEGAKWAIQLASAIIAKERAEKEELETKLNLSGIDNENLRIEIQFLKKENDDLADKYGKSVEENLDLKEKLIELRKENEQLKNPFKDIKNFGKPL